MTTGNTHDRSLTLDQIRSLLLLHPAGYQGFSNDVPTYLPATNKWNNDYSTGILRLAQKTDGVVINTLLSKAWESLCDLGRNTKPISSLHALAASLLMRPEIGCSGSELTFQLRFVSYNVDNNLVLGMCYAGLFDPCCEDNLEHYFEFLEEQCPELIGKFIEISLSMDFTNKSVQSRILANISKQNMLNRYLDRQFYSGPDYDEFCRRPEVRKVLDAPTLNDLGPTEIRFLLEALKEVAHSPLTLAESPSTPIFNAIWEKASLLAGTVHAVDETARGISSEKLYQVDPIWGLAAQIVIAGPSFSPEARSTALQGVYVHDQLIGVELAKLVALAASGELLDQCRRIATIASP